MNPQNNFAPQNPQSSQNPQQFQQQAAQNPQLSQQSTQLRTTFPQAQQPIQSAAPQQSQPQTTAYPQTQPTQAQPFTQMPTNTQFTTTQPQFAQPAQPGIAQAFPTTGQPTTPAPAAPTQALPSTVENPISTQSTLLISELRDGVVIMKDGSFRAVIACQSINFDLMSEQEREGVEYSYQNFLNSLSFTVQMLVRSQRVDIGPYIERLIKMRQDNDNMLLGVLMDDYINFIDILSQEANIMDKAFFIVIPYYTSADAEKLVEQTKNLFKTFGKNKAPNVTRINRDDYDKALDELNKRVDSVMSGLFQVGIQSARLNTKELGELYYNFNNPDTAVREPLVDFSKMATTYVRKGDR